MEHSLAYQYEQLVSDSSFRVLELLAGEKSDTLAFRLQIADWEDSPAFEALSYAWGDPKIKVAAICDEGMIPITTNLSDALRAMRHECHSRFLWADAVCIDQKNTKERAHQVSHMRTIYRKSSRVLVWLGRDDEKQAAKAAAAIQEIAFACCDADGILPVGLRHIDDLWIVAPNVPFHNLECDNADTWRCVAWYFALTWFSRLWVFQEVNSGSQALMMCGDTEVDWDVAALASTYIRKSTGIRQLWGFPSSHINNIYIMRHRRVHRTFSPPQLLTWVRSFDASDPLDRVYALMGMPPIANMVPPWEVDYVKTREQLYIEFAARSVLEVQGLNILACVQHANTIQQDFPSWVPQWDHSQLIIPISRSFAFEWDACGKSCVLAQVDVLNSVLKIEGIVLDRIHTKLDINSSAWFDSRNHVLPEHPVLDFWHSQKSNPTKYPTGQPSIEAFAAVLTAGLDCNANRATEKPENFYADFMSYIVRLLQLSGQDTSLAHDAQGWENWSKYEYRARLGPNAILPDDVVCVMFGGIVPFVLRPAQGHYQLVGDAYVHGVMDGEAVHQWEAGELEKQMFEIH
ncbi:hypothetical protein EG328_011832 [Venturia inaequalis]|uniref:Heterokaryon incompatibility domain-containing protein n=1 Tax=Venturia inaequalis TaxID=5025 RepID=A0A8H3V4Y6_VENIN|nr:hypothetical protein EG328_011832 [Venturia inaequalis]KAE9986735.1 hypothetical protein EG327_004187 [Venturia inaequalis]